jgi:N-glycosylase/DNA lyase
MMNVSFDSGQLTISSISDFSLEQCLCCGQAFRWKTEGEGFRAVALGRSVYAEQHGDTLALQGVDEYAAGDFIRYFDLKRDYGAIKEAYAADPFLRGGMEYAGGIRVLRQPPFETLISFIISQNNNVKRISGIIERLCERYGEPLGGGYDFPVPEALARCCPKDFEELGAGYRASYIAGAASMVAQGFDLEGLASLPYEQAREMLQTLPGVGPKVADCVALYSLGFTQAFPADVWMKRVLKCVYGFSGNDKQMRAFVDKKFGLNAGLAQQYLFHYARNNRCALQEQ